MRILVNVSNKTFSKKGHLIPLNRQNYNKVEINFYSSNALFSALYNHFSPAAVFITVGD